MNLVGRLFDSPEIARRCECRGAVSANNNAILAKQPNYCGHTLVLKDAVFAHLGISLIDGGDKFSE